jgi:hypothetical protein
MMKPAASSALPPIAYRSRLSRPAPLVRDVLTGIGLLLLAAALVGTGFLLRDTFVAWNPPALQNLRTDVTTIIGLVDDLETLVAGVAASIDANTVALNNVAAALAALPV